MASARLILAVASLSGFLLFAAAGAQQRELPDDAGKARVRPALRQESTRQAELAILKSAEEFAAAYNRHDAQAIAAGFTAAAEYVTDDGQRLGGTAPIAAHFAAMFERFPETQITLTVESIRLIAPQTAIEEGTVDAEYAPDRPADSSRYVAVHVREAGGWQIAAVREFGVAPEPVAGADRLQELNWMIGEWINEDEHFTSRMSCRLVDGGAFILQQLSLQVAGQPPIQTTTRIGWDAQARQFRSWTFDSQGGFSSGRWTRGDGHWLIKSRGVTRLGRTFSATAELRQVDPSTITLSSRDRVEGGAITEIGRVITVERVPPPPEE